MTNPIIKFPEAQHSLEREFVHKADKNPALTKMAVRSALLQSDDGDYLLTEAEMDKARHAVQEKYKKLLKITQQCQQKKIGPDHRLARYVAGLRKIRTIEEADFEQKVLKSKTPVLVTITAEWCSICHFLLPTLKESSESLAGRVDFFVMDRDRLSQDFLSKWKIHDLPERISFNGGQVTDRFAGAAPDSQEPNRLKTFQLLNLTLKQKAKRF